MSESEFKWGDEVEWVGTEWSPGYTYLCADPNDNDRCYLLSPAHGSFSSHKDDIRHPKKTVTVEIDVDLVKRINDYKEMHNVDNWRYPPAEVMCDLFDDMCKAIAEGAGDA